MHSIWLLVGITALAGVGGTGLGGAIACLFRKDSDKTVSLLLSFAAGAMLYVVVEELISEMSAGEHSNIGVIAFAFGFSVMMALDVALG